MIGIGIRPEHVHDARSRRIEKRGLIKKIAATGAIAAIAITAMHLVRAFRRHR